MATAPALPRVSYEDEFTPTNGQVAFTLTATPRGGKAVMYVRGIKQDQGIEYGVVGNILTFVPAAAGFTLDSTDKVEVYYEV